MSIDEKTLRILKTITPVQWAAILKVAQENVKPSLAMSADTLENKVCNLVKALGVPPHYMGYKYLQDAVILMCQDKKNIRKVTCVIYPAIARKYGVKAGSVERNIRHAILRICNYGDPNLINKVFGKNNFTPKGIITNACAITCLAEYVTKT